MLGGAVFIAVAMLQVEARAAAAPPPMDAAEIRLALEKLNVLGRMLYVAAHPDDENTNLISYFANGALYETAYLSLTRGDGGQNLIGPELGEQLGVIRTQELLAARQIDRGRQFFTRANDFGFSKSAEETMRIWDREKILADTVWAIRRFQPDVIVTRFPLDDDRTHGHHTASALLAREAFDAAADPKRFPEQLKFVQPWQATRILWNASQFFFRARNVPFDESGLERLNAAGFQPLLGRSFVEISAASRTMHKSQGFGVSIERGPVKEYFKFLAGQPVENGDILSGIDATWARVQGGASMAEQVRALVAGYDIAHPAASVPALLDLRKSLHKLGESIWKTDKLAAIDELIAACLGLNLQAVTDKPNVQPGQMLTLQLEAINRSTVPMFATIGSERVELKQDELVTRKQEIKLPENAPFSQPYWLRERRTEGTFAVADQTLIGLPENPPPLDVPFTIEVGGQQITYTLEPRFRRVDRVEGEVNEPLVVAPPVFVTLPRPVFVFANTAPKTVNVRVIAAAEAVAGSIALEAPSGWKVEPASVPVDFRGRDSESNAAFQITPPPAAGEATLRATFTLAGGQPQPAFSRERIAYPHIEPQTLIPRAEAKLVRSNIENRARRVGYLPGAGDDIPASLREIGSEVHILSDAEVKAAHLAQFDAVVFGVRAVNVHPARVNAWMPELLAYGRTGGVVMMQYNTTPGPTPEQLPYPLKISRDRVTDENAEVRFLAPEHPVLSGPNKITPADFAGWCRSAACISLTNGTRAGCRFSRQTIPAKSRSMAAC
jgi:LmbE family N-acetylglucosaminyl deacetylase